MLVAVLMRYGHQPRSEILAMSVDELIACAEQILELVREENLMFKPPGAR